MHQLQVSFRKIVASIMKQEAGIPVNDIYRELGIRDATFYNWKAKYGGMEANDITKPCDLQKENTEFKKMFAEMILETRTLKNLIEEKLYA